ncbi:MAG: CapA family protein [Deltaproteobacteria bacterium]|jgi:poly-gamma-glutamate synthesis protein (capsule biosynthesis protein)|nr:CapA family protein [Deltaproteobacteria bacterium]
MSMPAVRQPPNRQSKGRSPVLSGRPARLGRLLSRLLPALGLALLFLSPPAAAGDFRRPEFWSAWDPQKPLGRHVILPLGRRPPVRGRDVCTVRLMAVGDVLIHEPLRLAAARPEGGYDFRPFFSFLAPLFRQADLVVANLEVPLAGADRGFSGYPSFNAPTELAADLKASGVTTLLLANNHSLDRGWTGLEATRAAVEAAGLDYAGAYADPQDKARRLVSVNNGLLVALLNYSYGFNGRAGPDPSESWKLGFIDEEAIFADLAQARAQGADFAVVALHFGQEYRLKPDAAQIELAEKLLAGRPEEGLLGADLILGAHPHVVQPFAAFNRDGRRQAVVYSLGNFVSNQTAEHTFIGLLFDALLTVTPDGRRTVDQVKLIPTWCRRSLVNGRRRYAVVPLAEAVAAPETYGLASREAEVMAKRLQALEARLIMTDEAAGGEGPKIEPPAAGRPDAAEARP